MDQQFQIRTIAWLVAPDNEPLFSEIATTIRINDHAAGEFIEVEQGESGKIQISPNEWPKLREAIDHAISQCRSDE